LGLTFLNAGFLFAALAALIPLVIHLISRRRVETVDWSSLRFLKELERKRIRRVRLRQILLLIVRSLIILAVALAVARPTLSGGLLGRGSGHAKTSVAIVLDDSGSMGRRGDGGDLFDAAVGVAREIVDLLEEGDQAFLVRASDPPEEVRPGGTFSRDALVEELRGMAPGAAATDYAGAIAVASDLLAGARNLNRELYIIGDVQRTGWSGGPRGPAERPAGREGAPPARAYVLPIDGPEGNLGVSAVSVSRKYGGTPGLHAIVAEVVNHGRRRADVPVRLFVDGVQVGQAGVEAEAGGSAMARFATSVDESEWHDGWVELPEDVLDVDNRRYFVVAPLERVEVLLVRAEAAGERDEAYYVHRALDPTLTADRFRVAEVALSSLESQEQGRFPVVILADVGRLDAGAERWLARHSSEGGGLLVVLGSRTDIRYWNRGPLAAAAGVVLREPVVRERGVRLAPVAPGHPLLEGLTVGDRLIDDVSVRRAFTALIEESEVVLELPGIGPALAVARTPSSEIGVLLTGLDPAWNGLPRSGFLVPLLHRVVERLAGGAERAASVDVGEDLVVPIASARPGRVEVTLPDGSGLAPTLRAGRRPTAVIERVRAPGIYRFEASGRRVALGAVNPTPAESDLAQASREAIGEHLAAWEHRFIGPTDTLASEILESRRGRELWRVFVYVALGLIAIEMFLARPRFA